MHIFYEGLSALEKNQSDPTLLSRYNKTFDIPSDIVLPKNTQIHSVDQLDYHTFFQIKKEAKENGGFHIIRAAFPYLICDQYPEMLSWVKEISPFESRCSSLFRIAIHVRRGELFVVDSQRMLPNEYYINVV